MNSFSYILWFRITHDGCAIPEDLLMQMSGRSSAISEDGISLFVSRKIVMLVNGDVRYSKEDNKFAWIISVNFVRAVKSE